MEGSKLQTRLTTEIFPQVLANGTLGSDVEKFVHFDACKDKKTGGQCCSNIVFGDVTLATSAGERLTQPVVIKTCRLDIAEEVDFDSVFYNEVLFYEKIMPLLRKQDKSNVLSNSFCDFIYGKATNGQSREEDIIILKDLSERGFKPAKDKLHLDTDHVTLVLDRLGKFHALSLLSQANEPEKYKEVTSQIKYTFFGDVVENMCQKEEIREAFFRGIEPLRKDPNYKNRLKDISLNCKDGMEWMKKCAANTGLLSVIAHGDFLNHNMMFKYGANGQGDSAPTEVAFYDLGTTILCSPAVDLSIFLALNVTAEVRKAHWDDFLRTYYGALTSQLAGHQNELSFEAFELDLRIKGGYGYCKCSLYGGMLMENYREGKRSPSPPPSSKGHDETRQSEEDFDILKMGGPKATEMLAGIARHMIDKNYIFDLKH